MNIKNVNKIEKFNNWKLLIVKQKKNIVIKI